MSSFTSLNQNAPQRASVFIQDNPLDVLEFDASVSETHSGDAAVTDHPVEEGSDISDHVRRNPESIQIQAIITNHPIVVARSITGLPSVRGGDPNNRAQDAYGFLRDQKDAGTVMGVSTTLRDYANMVITSLSVSRDATTGNIADIAITLREIIIAQTETVDAPEPENPARKKKAKLGKKNKPEASPATEAKSQSFLNRAGEALGDLATRAGIGF